jgi:ATP-binding cassette subfamily F protein uup
MSYIEVESLTKEVSDKKLFTNISFAIKEGEKIALVAQNGTGKSTLLKILADKIAYDNGNITMQRGIRVAYLPQEPDLDLDKTIEEEIFGADSQILKIVRDYEKSLETPEDTEKMQRAFDAMNEFNAWEYEDLIHELLDKLRLKDLTGKISTLSGGQRKRIALVKILLDKSDVLLLDEPTNHLDIDMIDWLADYLSSKNLTLLLVTHDRYFLDKVCNKILELDRENIYKHNGNYSYYLEQKEKRYIDQNANIDKTRALLKKELEYVRKSPRGRLSQSGARVDAYYKLKESVGEKNITKKVELDVVSERLGFKILEFHNISKSYGNKIILNKFSYGFKRGEKIGIVGPNGVGKTTLLNIILEHESIDSGKIVKGETVNFGYYSQHQEELNPNLKVIDTIKEIASEIKLSNGTEISASKMLERFLFTPIEQQNPVSKLSGGEKKRLALLRILMANPNFLVLDEPTNDFDLMTLEVLEEFLRNFKGCLIIVSHDRYFMDSIVDHLFVFEGNGEISVFPGNYTDYRNSSEYKSVDSKVTTQVSTPIKNTNEKLANELYREINELENKKKKLEEKLFNIDQDYEAIRKITEQIKDLEIEIDKKNDTWLGMAN